MFELFEDQGCFGTPIRGHTVLHTRTGLGISTLQWIFSSAKLPLKIFVLRSKNSKPTMVVVVKL